MLYIGKIKTDSIRRLLRPAGEKEGLILYQKISFSYDKNGNKTKEVRHGGYWNEEGYTDANGGVITYKEPADEGGVMGIVGRFTQAKIISRNYQLLYRAGRTRL